MAKTKSVGGKDLTASNFAYVGDANDPSTWHLPIPDANHVRDALARFNQTEIPEAAKKRVAKRLLTAAKKAGIDASGFAAEQGMKASEAAAEDYSFEELQTSLQNELLDKFGRDERGWPQYSLCETFPDYVIAQGPDGCLYQITYKVGGDEEDIELGDPQEVETTYVSVAESARLRAKERNAAYTAGLVEAGALFPGDPVVQHRFAERAANRLLRRKSSRDSKESNIRFLRTTG